MLLHHFCSILIILSFFPDGHTESLDDSTEYIEALDNEAASGLKTKEGKQSDDPGAEGNVIILLRDWHNITPKYW